MKRTSLFVSVVLLTLFGLNGCKSNWSKPSLALAKKNDVDINHKATNSEPDYITVQHCLIGFRGSVAGKTINRTKEEARALAVQLLADAKAGAKLANWANQTGTGINGRDPVTISRAHTIGLQTIMYY